MITITTPDGKFFFSSFLNLHEEQSGEVDENSLTVKDLQYLLTAVKTSRILISEEDVEVVQNRITILTSSSGGGSEGVDPSLLLSKEDKSNKVKVIGIGSDISYPTTNAVKALITTEIQELNLSSYAKSVTVNANLLGKVDKTELTKYALKTDIPELTQTNSSTTNPVVENRVPLYTLGTDGNYVLCTPNAWVHLGNNLYMPAYNGSVLGL